MLALRLSLWAVGAAVGVVGEWQLYGWGDPGHWAPDLVAGWSMLGCGLLVWSLQAESRTGPLMAATGLAWFAGNFVGADAAWITWLSAHALYLYRGPLVHLVLGYPYGRRAGLLVRAATAAGYVAAVATPVWQSQVATIALAVGLVAVAGASHRRTVGRERRRRLAALEATTFVALLVAGGAIARLVGSSDAVRSTTLLSQQVGLAILALALAAGLVARPWEREAVADIVVELGERRSGTFRAALARTLGDPTLQVAYRSPDGAGYIDDAGRPVELPPPGGGRSATRVERGEELVAVVVHDPAVLDDPGLVAELDAAYRLSASHARLRAQVRAQLAELGESRRRLLRAGDAERQRLEARLRNGAEQRLLRLEELLATARARPGTAPELSEQLRRADEQLRETLSELRELAQGLHPRAVSEQGLAQALASLAERGAVPVTVAVAVERLPDEVEAAAWYVCSEALANVAKHASASRASVSVVERDGIVDVEVVDDGVGRADPTRGSGLRGLADRIEALGGTLTVESVPGGGTRVVACLPLGLS